MRACELRAFKRRRLPAYRSTSYEHVTSCPVQVAFHARSNMIRRKVLLLFHLLGSPLATIYPHKRYFWIFKARKKHRKVFDMVPGVRQGTIDVISQYLVQYSVCIPNRRVYPTNPYVAKITLDWVIDRSFTPKYNSHFASSAGHGFESHFERSFQETLARAPQSPINYIICLPGSPGRSGHVG